MAKHKKCRECANFVPIGDTVYGHCKVRPFAKKQGGQLTDKEFITSRGRYACKVDFVEVDEIPEVVKSCKRCGQKFTVPERSRRVFCCDKCREKWHIEQKSEERKAIKEKKASAKTGGRPKVKQPKVPLSEVMKMAAAEHLSYGEVVLKYGL